MSVLGLFESIWLCEPWLRTLRGDPKRSVINFLFSPMFNDLFIYLSIISQQNMYLVCGIILIQKQWTYNKTFWLNGQRVSILGNVRIGIIMK